MCSPGGFVLFILSVSFLLNLLHIPRVVVSADSSSSGSSNGGKVALHIDITRKRSIQLNGIEIDENSLLNHLEDHERELIFGKERTKREVKLVHLRQRTDDDDDADAKATRNGEQQKHQRVKRSNTATTSASTTAAAAAENIQSVGAQQPTQEVSVQIQDDDGDHLANLHLRPTPKLIDDSFIFIRRYANTTQLIEDSNELAQKYANCFYSNENSALDLCDDENVRGILHHNSTDYIIHPLPPRFGKSSHVIVTKSNNISLTPTDLSQTLPPISLEYPSFDENVQFEPDEEEFNEINTTTISTTSKRPARNANYTQEQNKSNNNINNLSTTILHHHKSTLPSSYNHIQRTYRPRYQPEKDQRQHDDHHVVQHKRKHRRHHHRHTPPSLHTKQRTQPYSHNERERNRDNHNHNHYKQHRRKRRYISSGSQGKIPQELHIETAIFVDKDLLKHMAKNFPKNTESHVIRFVLAMINGVQLLYHHPSLGRRVNFVLKRLEILYTDPKDLSRSSDIDTYLSNFCVWQKNLNPASDLDKTHFDHAVILTGLDLYVINNNGKVISQVVGLAPVAGMCQPTSSCTINEGKHFESVFVVAHEIGHNLGMRHDAKENSCDPTAFIMSPTLGSGKITWSKCSRTYLNTFLDTLQGNCLFDRGQFINNLDHSAEGMLPGERFDANQQCMLKFGKDTVRAPRQTKSDICRDLHCQRDRYTWTSHPALEGTECGDSMWCRSGVCVSKPSHQSDTYTEPKQLHGNTKLGGYDKSAFLEATKMGHLLHEDSYNKIPTWSDWGEASECASGCLYGASKRLREGSTGLKTYKRSCPDYRRRCNGKDQRYESCIAKLCYSTAITPTTIEDFASQVCESAKFDSELTGEGLQIVGDIEESCKVYCKTKFNGTKSRRRIFPDGTTCRSTQYNLHDISYCIEGRCERFSCDNTTSNYYKIDPKFCEYRQQPATPATAAAQPTEQNQRRWNSNANNRQVQSTYNRYADRDNNYSSNINREVSINGPTTVRNKFENEVAIHSYHGTQQDQAYRRKSDQYQAWNKYNYQLNEQRSLPAPPPTQAAPVSASLISATASEPYEWIVKSGCHSSCMAKSKGIQVVMSRKTAVNNIQLCTHTVKPCDRLQTPTEYAENTCARYKLKVRGLSGHGTQIAASIDEPDRSCRVGCQDEYIKYRFYLVNGRYGHFPLGTKCSNTEERYCVNGKCLEFGPNNIPLKQSQISLALFRKRRSLTEQRSIGQTDIRNMELTGNNSQSRRKRSYLYYEPVNITETITQDFINSIVQGIVDFEEQQIFDKLSALEQDHIEFNNPIHVMTDELKTP